MSTERDHGAGAHGAQGADAGPDGRPNVYHPQTGAAPSYEEYADPASAHGWHPNAYDETARLPVVPAPREPAEGRAERRRRQRRTGSRRRTVILAGALGAAGTVAVIAALAGGSDSPGPGRTGPSGRGRVAAGDSAAASPRTDTGPASAAPATGTSGPAAPSGPAASPAVTASRPRATGWPTVATASASAQAPAVSRPPVPTGTTAGPTVSAPGWKHGRGGRWHHH
ncbi:hypothetical protein ACH41H_16285 [Streptomyces sp. NPDC020800]|uniref:hypothetical protein n=1 Tax=Streptomyces sp. NPDC020800 TaxID=3365092 RepID=UPI00378EF090